MVFPKKIPIQNWNSKISLRTPKLITFDAYNTLYATVLPVMEQYSNVASIYGVKELSANFPSVYSKLKLEHPNYGKNTGISAKQWWQIMITEVFKPIKLSDDVVEAILDRFGSCEAFFVYPDLIALLKGIRQKYPDVIFGVISNADPYAGDVIKSFGLDKYFDGNIYLSYDVGFSKPDQKIYEYALDDILNRFPDLIKNCSKDEFKQFCWHIGDEKINDMEGPAKTGLVGILIDRVNKYGYFDGSFADIKHDLDMHKIDNNSLESWEIGIKQTDTFQVSDREYVISNLRTLATILDVQVNE